MAEKRMTKREMFAQILTHLTDAAEVEFIERQIELLENKSGKTSKPTAKQVENAALKEAIVTYMVPGATYTVTEIMENCLALVEVGAGNQKVSALMKQLVDAGVVTKAYEKRKPYFSLVG